MNSLVLAFLSIILLVLGYRVYGARIEKLFGVNNKEETPAHKLYDGVDYVPARNWLVLFGHHFSSIAGAGPIIGPIIALSIWGWAPAVLWIVIGSILIGGTHDFGSLLISVKHEGRSVTDIAESLISRRAKILFASFVWLALILVIAVFVYLCAETLSVEPKIVIPTFGLIVVALLVGHLLYNVRAGIYWVTILGLTLTVIFIFLGEKFPIQLAVGNPKLFWGYILLGYCFVASVLPVHMLLQPRDYLSAYFLFFGIIAGYAGIIITHPQMAVPAWSSADASGNAMWPMLFVIVACGAISGFHSLIASGTSSKQLSNQAEAKRIGYGAMLTEGALAVLVVIAVGAGLGGREVLSGYLSQGGSGPISAFGSGYGAITKPILFGMGGLVAIIILNAFILTTLDTATRIGRYLTHELFGIKNRFIATAIVVALSGWLGLSGNWAKIWPIFGATNQLIAALALLVITVWLLRRKKNVYYAAIPGAFMLITTVAALLYSANKYIRTGDYLLVGMSAVLLFLSGYLLYEVIVFIKRRKYA
ncbi:MAG: carbon starvation protein A [Candidatus Omnitrophica bacterium]|nr:carbon starvation protein A [Candidatus Omnitrophota bacterium]MCG2705874.1 carbon starvation protein A [Candidatus Omnitrophota bacterium]